MPCKVCRKVFVITPCKHPTGIFEESLANNGVFYHAPFASSQATLKEIINRYNFFNIYRYYKLLKARCPCKECLIKGICIEGGQCMVVDYNEQKLYITPTI